MNKTLLHTNNLTVGYSSAKKVLTNVSISVELSEMVLVAGRNGSGKSTLLSTLIGLIPALSGDVFIFGDRVNDLSYSKKSRVFSYVPAKPVLLNDFTIRQLIETGRAPYTGWSNKFSEPDRFAVEEAAEKLRISHILKSGINAVSDGERQKAMIARAIAQDTPLIVLDEPTAFLDYPSRIELIQILKMLTSDMKKAVVFSSHDLEVLIPVVDFVWFCNNGKIISDCTAKIVEMDSFKSFYNKIQ